MMVYVLVGLVAVGLLRPAGLAASASPLNSAMVLQAIFGGPNYFGWRFSGDSKRFVNGDFRGFTDGLFDGRRNDLPSALARLHHRFFTPYYAILAAGMLMAALVLFVDLTSVVAVSTFALLFTYCIVNISAFKLKSGENVAKFCRCWDWQLALCC